MSFERKFVRVNIIKLSGNNMPRNSKINQSHLESATGRHLSMKRVTLQKHWAGTRLGMEGL